MNIDRHYHIKQVRLPKVYEMLNISWFCYENLHLSLIGILGGRANIKFYKKSKVRFKSKQIVSADSWIGQATFKCIHDTLIQKLITK